MGNSEFIQHGNAGPRARQKDDRLKPRQVDRPQVVEKHSAGAAPVRVGPGKKDDAMARG
jgi:hypothetical protein